MTPEELRAYAQVMKAEGIFRATIDGVSIEMSQAALAYAAVPTPQPAHQSADGPSPHDPKRAPDDEDDPFQYAATEGMPG